MTQTVKYNIRLVNLKLNFNGALNRVSDNRVLVQTFQCVGVKMKVFEIQLALFLMVCVIIGSTIEQGYLSDELVSILYLKYKEALGNGM